MKFLDQAKIYIASGHGGPGSISFRREAHVPFGGPDGGNGGRGGDVIALCSDGLNTLIDFRYQQHFKAKRGIHGMGSQRDGSKGASLIINVPVGTQVFDEHNEYLIADFIKVGQMQVLACGGDGGFGNAHFKTSTNQAPRRFDAGWPGEEMWVWLRLKLIADVGLVGLPNAGKSTFLGSVSRARPKIADYPFTTLHPNLGVVGVDDKEFVLADIPGLIEGAHEGAGLGTRFLGHVERCGLLMHLVDGTSEDIERSYKIIRSELESYGSGLTNKAEVVALNKCDALTEDDIAKKLTILNNLSSGKVFRLSSIAGLGIDEILRYTYAVVSIGRENQKVEERMAFEP